MFAFDPRSDILSSLVNSFRELCTQLDPDAVPLPEAPAMWSAFDTIEKLAAGAKCRLARRVDESKAWRRQGHRSAADWIASQAGTSPGRARAGLETSKRLASLPGTDEAVRAGELSGEQADAVADAASAAPEAEQRLLGTAKRRPLRDLREECARAKARAADEQARHERLHRQRALHTFKGTDGSWNLRLRNTPEVGAEIEAALAPITDRIFNDARLQGRHEPREAYAADALTELARTDTNTDAAADGEGEGDGADRYDVADDDGQPESGQDPRPDPDASDPTPTPTPRSPNRAQRRRLRRSRRPDTKVIALIDYEALKRGHAEGGETCEIAGVGAVPVATVRAMLTDAFGAAIVTNGVDVRTVAHLGRAPSAHQRTALEARGYRCEVPGCGSTTALEIDHIEDWQYTHRTRLAHLAWLCRPHHLDKTHHRWHLHGPPGDRTWLPPDPAGRRAPTDESNRTICAEPSPMETLW